MKKEREEDRQEKEREEREKSRDRRHREVGCLRWMKREGL